MTTANDNDKLANEIVVIGAMWMILSSAGATVTVLAGNTMEVEFDFLRSPYRVTVEQLEP